MAALSPRGRAVIESGKRALRATATDRARVEAALRERLGVDVLPPDPLPAPPSPIAPRGVLRFLSYGATAAVVGGALVFALTPRARDAAVSSRAPVQVHDAAVALPPPVPADEAVVEGELAAPLPPAPAPSPRAGRRGDRLAQEVALMSRATSALKAGRTEEALGALEAHRRRFPRGVLTEERRAARAQALCTVGRVREGRAELAQLAPSSPAVDRAQQLCSASEQARSSRN